MALSRTEAEQQLSSMKLHFAETQRSLLHQLHLERRRVQDHRASWEKQLEVWRREELRLTENTQKQDEESQNLRKTLLQTETGLKLVTEQLKQSEEEVKVQLRAKNQLENSLNKARNQCKTRLDLGLLSLGFKDIRYY